jgi:MoaA/NifB/PqqE/SkfB family radical SAM enzyme
MPINKRHKAQIDSNGRLELPPGLGERFGFQPGEQVILEENGREIILHRPVNFLERAYVEATNSCNLGCRTCLRNVWQEPLGWMSADTFARILDGVQSFSPPPTIFFGGFGEPLAHPDITAMVAKSREVGAPVELITNGVLLSEEITVSLLESGLDVLWVSLDGATPESYLDVRLGDELPTILANLRRFRKLRRSRPGTQTRLGIAFVAMRRNLDDLPVVIDLALELDASYFTVTNVLAYNLELRQETLYDRTQYDSSGQKANLLSWVNLPRTDMTSAVQKAFTRAVNAGCQVQVAGLTPRQTANRCPFIEKGSLSVRWDGQVSPCLALLHSHDSYLDDHLRCTHAHFIGNLAERSLAEIWRDPAYVSLRQRLMDFDFSPCTICNSCEMAEQNLEDCFGNLQPTCGGCLWAQGIIQCP